MSMIFDYKFGVGEGATGFSLPPECSEKWC